MYIAARVRCTVASFLYLSVAINLPLRENREGREGEEEQVGVSEDISQLNFPACPRVKLTRIFF